MNMIDHNKDCSHEINHDLKHIFPNQYNALLSPPERRLQEKEKLLQDLHSHYHDLGKGIHITMATPWVTNGSHFVSDH